MIAQKNTIISQIGILLLVFFLFSIIYNITIFTISSEPLQPWQTPEISPVPESPEQPDILNESTIFSFGEIPVILSDNESPGSGNITTRLEKVAAETNQELEKTYFPRGPVLGVGYSGDEVIVLVYRDWTANETVIREIYSVVERHGEQNGIRKIPCKFLSVGLIKKAPSGIVPGMSRWPLKEVSF
jgi:hypothetical protein